MRVEPSLEAQRPRHHEGTDPLRGGRGFAQQNLPRARNVAAGCTLPEHGLNFQDLSLGARGFDYQGQQQQRNPFRIPPNLEVRRPLRGAPVAERQYHSRDPPQGDAYYPPRQLAWKSEPENQRRQDGDQGQMSLLRDILKQQSLPKVVPDIFSGEPTAFHSWKEAFEAMVTDTSITAQQELVYMLQYTSAKPRQLVETFRNRRMPAEQCVDKLWRELGRRFGSSAVVSNTYTARLTKLAAYKEGDSQALQTFADLCEDVVAQMEFIPSLRCLDFYSTSSQVYNRLPSQVRSKWNKKVVRYAERFSDEYPSFAHFTEFISELARFENHPNVVHGGAARGQHPTSSSRVKAYMTELSDYDSSDVHGRPSPTTVRTDPLCVMHPEGGHDLARCRAFKRLEFRDKIEVLRENKLCFKCLKPSCVSNTCTVTVKCSRCQSDRHLTILHKDKPISVNVKTTNSSRAGEEDEEVRESEGPNTEPCGTPSLHDLEVKRTELSATNTGPRNPPHESLGALCTTVCRTSRPSEMVNSSPIILGEVFSRDRAKSLRVYAILDTQANGSILSPAAANLFGHGVPRSRFTLTTCNREEEKLGRRIVGLSFRRINGFTMELPTLLECDIPPSRKEIVRPEWLKHHPHLAHLEQELPPYEASTAVHLLIGRDAPEFLKIWDFINGKSGEPWAQKSLFGWCILGNLCKENTEAPATSLEVHRTSVKNLTSSPDPRVDGSTIGEEIIPARTGTEEDIFVVTRDDDKLGLSQEDKRFLDIMRKGMRVNELGNWELPLPFRQRPPILPENRFQVLNRFRRLQNQFKRKPKLKNEYDTFMKQVISKGHASRASPTKAGKYYLPHFPVFNEKKGKIRIVYDGSAEFHGLSLNRALIQGPDQMNGLIGVLLRWRFGEVALICDVDQFFHNFHVPAEDRDYLRFFWVDGDDPCGTPVEYCMNVHNFGNCSSPAVANFALRRTALLGEETFGTPAKDFITKGFYCDDGLLATSSPQVAVDVVQSARAMLKSRNITLHKIVSNSPKVLESFPAEALASGFQNLDFGDPAPLQRSLGIGWDVTKDVFIFRLDVKTKPFTRRGALSIINSIYDVFGFCCPVVLPGKMLLREMIELGKSNSQGTQLGWDDELPAILRDQWTSWIDTLRSLDRIAIPRNVQSGSSKVRSRELHGFSDASDLAIGICIYLKGKCLLLNRC